MRFLVFGKTGQVARALGRLECADLSVTCLDRNAADLRDPAACAAAIMARDADVVINAAAYTAVDRAETEEPLALTINAQAPAAMARACALRDIPFLHISTDYVFDGGGSAPWHPDSPTAPISAYGRTKLAGEQAVCAAGGRHAILRTSWVFSADGNNFVKTMLRLAKGNTPLRIVADQIGGPTAAADIADTLATMARSIVADSAPVGIYHFAGAPETSWADFARAIFSQAALAAPVIDIPASAYPTAARRPANSRLNCDSLKARFGVSQPDWRVSLGTVLQDLKDDLT